MNSHYNLTDSSDQLLVSSLALICWLIFRSS